MSARLTDAEVVALAKTLDLYTNGANAYGLISKGAAAALRSLLEERREVQAERSRACAHTFERPHGVPEPHRYCSKCGIGETAGAIFAKRAPP